MSFEVLDPIPEDQPLTARRWWHAISPISLSSSSQTGSSTRGVEGGRTGTEDTGSSLQSEGPPIAAPDRPTAPLDVLHARRCCRRTNLGLISVVVVLLLGAVVGIFFIVDATKAPNSSASNVTAAPTEAPADRVPQSAEDRGETIALLMRVSGDSLENETSAQRMALNWILLNDEYSVSTGIHGDDRVVQRYTLGVFYFALDGVNWNTSGYLTAENECSWTGVTCNDAELVVFYNLGRLGLRGSIPPEIRELKLLEQLNLSANAISGRIPEELYELPFLYSIDLQNNQLAGSISPLLWDLPFLEYLYLNTNRLSGTLPDLPTVMPALKHVWLQENALVGPMPPALPNLVGLETLVAYDNEFNDSIEIQFSKMTKLYYIDLSWNNFTGNFPDLSFVSSLEFLYLNNNQLMGPLDANLGSLTHLQEVWLQSNRFTGSIPNEWSQLSNLTALLVQETDLNGTVPEGICNLTLLVQLEADCNETTTGSDGNATAGNDGNATTGNDGIATAGNGGNATAGNGGNARTGRDGIAATGNGGNETTGNGGNETTGGDGVFVECSCCTVCH